MTSGATTSSHRCGDDRRGRRRCRWDRGTGWRTSTGTGGKEPKTVTECGCREAGAGDTKAWPWALAIAGLGVVGARRRLGRATKRRT
ncbi:MAG: MYXO-CTERM sorting domain-containing protein [Polyangiaceae bacterium]